MVQLFSPVLAQETPTRWSHVWSTALPAACAGQWCGFLVDGVAAPARLRIMDAARGHTVRDVFLARGRIVQGLTALVHVPREAGAVTLEIFSAQASPSLRVVRLSRGLAASLLLPRAIPGLAAALLGSPLGLPGRLRTALGRASMGGAAAPGYVAWVALFDRWGEAERAALVGRVAGAPPLHAVVAGAAPDLVAATLRALTAQWHPLAGPPVILGDDGAWQRVAAEAPDGYVAILQAGEILPPHALAVAAASLAADPGADILYADQDRLARDGQRCAPFFKLPADPELIRAGLLAQGLWLVRASLLRGALPAGLPASADLARLALWLRLGRERPGLIARHLPFVLAHRAAALADPSPDDVARLAREDCAAAGIPVRVESGRPVRVTRMTDKRALPLVSMIVPSACRSAHVLRCLRAVIEKTDYPAFEILVAVSRIDPADARQAAILARVRALPRVRVVDGRLPGFNFSRINTIAAESAEGALLLLLNDDVAPIVPSWLSAMASLLLQPGVGAVGARLYYGNGSVQHAGVLLGLGGLCEHIDRLAPRAAPGYHGLARIDRPVSVVSAACLLVRRQDYFRVGGLDEKFAVALNDVDFCLKIRAAGLRILQSASAELFHYESLSLGRHYSGGRESLEAAEVGLLRRRWGAVLQEDPYYNLNLSLEVGREWMPAFPPRIGPVP